MLTLALCDDNAADRLTLRSYIEEYCLQKNVVVCLVDYTNAEALLADSSAQKCDAVFMDIYMSGMDGMACAKAMREKGYTGCFVFSTTSREHAVESFSVEAVDYLVKPLTKGGIFQAMERILRRCEDALQSVSVIIDGHKQAVYLKDLSFAETGMNHNTLLHLADETVTSSTLISDIETALADYPNFLRCHRSYLINMNYVEKVTDDTVIMADGSRVLLPVRRSFEIKKQIMDYLRKRMRESIK